MKQDIMAFAVLSCFFFSLPWPARLAEPGLPSNINLYFVIPLQNT